MNTHRQVHTGEKLFVCPDCNKNFSTKGSLVVHRRIHTGEKPYVCSECDMKFKAIGVLNVHHRRFHTGEKPFVCSDCDKKFLYKSNFIRHNKTHHGVKSSRKKEDTSLFELYECGICCRSFPTKEETVQCFHSH